MSSLEEKFKKLGIDSAPGQEVLQQNQIIEIRGEKIKGVPVDFSHGDVDAFKPIAGSLDIFIEGYMKGGAQAYTEYRGKGFIREGISSKLSNFTGVNIDPEENIIFTPGTQGALFLAMGSMIEAGDKVAIVEPDYFANRKLVDYFGGVKVPIELQYERNKECAGLNLVQLEEAFANGVKLFVFSNPNNPVGVIYSRDEIYKIASLANKYNVSLIVDELYSRQIFDNNSYCHLCKQDYAPNNIITIIGPSKTESLSGFRLGVAFGNKEIIKRMEKLQAIVSLRAAGYCQAVFAKWFSEEKGFINERTRAHQIIRDKLYDKIEKSPFLEARLTEAGSYMFIKINELEIGIQEFAKILRELAGVTITPGTEFGPSYKNHFRINFSQDETNALDAMDRIIEVIGRYIKK